MIAILESLRHVREQAEKQVGWEPSRLPSKMAWCDACNGWNVALYGVGAKLETCVKCGGKLERGNIGEVETTAFDGMRDTADIVFVSGEKL